jgi:hypothetical protein
VGLKADVGQPICGNGELVEGGNMRRLFASAPDIYAFETRFIRLDGQSTSFRPEKVFWEIPRFVSLLHQEILLLRRRCRTSLPICAASASWRETHRGPHPTAGGSLSPRSA